MTDEEYKKYICDICNRIISEKRINIVRVDESNKSVFKIQIIPTEWYIELENDVKFIVEYNILKIFEPLIFEALNEYNRQRKEELENNDISDTHSNKRRKI
tara:strand:+ start:121 stop:423 length:303 start_codon:yes stop_codon:yes gene_type:complete